MKRKGCPTGGGQGKRERGKREEKRRRRRRGGGQQARHRSHSHAVNNARSLARSGVRGAAKRRAAGGEMVKELRVASGMRLHMTLIQLTLNYEYEYEYEYARRFS